MSACRSCRFFHPVAAETLRPVVGRAPEPVVTGEQGECRRNPPQYVGQRMSVWPLVESTAWCGEFVAKESA